MDVWEALLQKEVQQFIIDNEKADVTSLVLRQKSILNVSPQWLAAQLVGRQKAKTKISQYYQGNNILYPPSVNLEQSSSEATALFKAKIISELVPGNVSLVDLSGGFGIDSFFLSQAVETLTHVEPNEELQKIAAHNHKQLGAPIIRYANQTAETFLDTLTETIDVFFVDPSRRKNGQKVYSLSDCEPNIDILQQTLFTKCKYLLVKAAPMLDIQSALKNLRFVKKIFVVSVENECKELLFWSEKGFTEEPELVAINLTTTGAVISSYSFTQRDEQTTLVAYSEPKKYLYEPNASILKAGAFKSMVRSFPVTKLASSTHLYTSDHFVENFPGRIFSIDSLVKGDVKTIHSLLPERKANVLTRNYPLKPEELKKKLKLKDGGDRYLIAFSGQKEKHLAMCSRIK